MNHLIPIPDTPPRRTTVVEWLARGVELVPEQCALCFNHKMLTHRELDVFSNRIARFLILVGVRPGGRVGLCLDRSIEMVAALVGILKAGAAYVPLDPAYPAERLLMMKEDACLDCLLVHAAHTARFPEALVWEDVAGEVLSESPETLDLGLDPESAAYIIFTSGSTGRPKGIEMPHRALANLIEWQLDRRSFKEHARVLQYSSISFDVSFQEIATTIASGGTLHLISNDKRKDVRKLLAQLVEQRIERLFLPYVALRSLVEAAHVLGIYPGDLKETITAGEQLRVDDAVRGYFREIGGATLDNQYGPSETHVITANLLEGDSADWPDLPGIGTPLKNCGTCILNDAMQPVAQGETGELYLAGRNLARGYIGREGLTAKTFVPSPFTVPGRPVLYKTGDLAAYNPDGSIEFLGRRDHQVKIRGHRIELGEINNAAASFPGIGQSLAHAVDRRLVCYYTVLSDAVVDVSALRQHLVTRLPEYRVPAFLIELAEIPFTPSGKVDFKALPKPSIDNSRYAGEDAGYASETEAVLAGIWGELLSMGAVPRSADFFEIGGDSLRAVTLFLRIQQQFGRDLPLAALAQAPTLAGLAGLIDGSSDAPELSGYRSLKMIQPGDAAIAPLFLIHGGQGNVLVFNNFAERLGSRQPVYAFQWAGWDGFRGESDVREMARAYFNELQRFLPGGPIRIGGYCIGGLIAVELVRQLKKAGRQILFPLVVWDSPNLESVHYRTDEPWDSAETIAAFNRMKQELEKIRIETAADLSAVPRSDFMPPSGGRALLRSVPGLMGLLRSGRRFLGWVRAMPIRIRIMLFLLRGQRVPMELRADYCLNSLVKAVRRHRSARCDGDMLYFRSDCVIGRFFSLRGWWDDPFLGYAELCAGNFEAHAVGGAHTDVLEIPEMTDIVKRAFE